MASILSALCMPYNAHSSISLSFIIWKYKAFHQTLKYYTYVLTLMSSQVRLQFVRLVNTTWQFIFKGLLKSKLMYKFYTYHLLWVLTADKNYDEKWGAPLWLSWWNRRPMCWGSHDWFTLHTNAAHVCGVTRWFSFWRQYSLVRASTQPAWAAWLVYVGRCSHFI